MSSASFAEALAVQLGSLKESLLAEHARAVGEALREHETAELVKLRAEGAELRAENTKLHKELFGLTAELRSDMQGLAEKMKATAELQLLADKKMELEIARQVAEALAIEKSVRDGISNHSKAEEAQAEQDEEDERERQRAEEQAVQRAAEEQRRAEEEAARMAAEDQREAEEEAMWRAAAEQHIAEEAAKQKAAEEQRRAEEEAKQRAAEEQRRTKEDAKRQADAEVERKEAEEQRVAAASRKAAEAQAEANASAADDKRKKAEASLEPARSLLDIALELAGKMTPGMHDLKHEGGRLWIVVGGGDTGGILVRQARSVQSPGYQTRLTTGTTVEELEVHGKRLHYRRIRGDGPDFGWVSIEGVGGRRLLEPHPAQPSQYGYS
mmetsp:Transcript_13222/g.36448  ORF Transcript_13222/g.36448 Transcript_13222/m.36448 type:complete len:383 (-) Transcript_13222:55-1203(-)|eukprot:CAMPEP_0179023190 /NCGR_PEP_ID=MMETSP0796-20121207/6799_1 /TAXON_ID=73915 /ORGANISM="Pyrodinium bahamense, Strain pbaha01" /LENGTH=382 /DNA_ID=CAMNT_0020719087 /DNA_START=29 /DNA_END=1177 /DNA_ORIENTATION=-